jgi:hypothetical protein
VGAFDQSARYAAVAEPGFVLQRLRPLLDLTLAFRGWFNTRSVPLPGGPDRDADLVAIADDDADADRAWLLIHEFQAQADADKAAVIQLEAMIFLCYAKDVESGGGRFRPLPVFVHLHGEPANNVVSVRTPSGRGFTGEPVEWDVVKDSAAETLDKVNSGEFSWGALFWISLMLGADDDKVVERWLRLVEETVPSEFRLNVRHIALVFSELAGRRPAWNRVVQGVAMTESAVVNEIIQLGELRMARNDLLRLVRLRFPALLTQDVERAIADQPSLALLKTWLDSAFDPATTAESFLAVLRR